MGSNDSWTPSHGWHNIYIRAEDPHGAKGYADTTIEVYVTEVAENLVSTIPSRFDLRVANSNPLSPPATIEFALSKAAEAWVQVYDIDGRLVNTLVSEILDVGYYEVKWQGSDLNYRLVPNGIYFIRFSTNEFNKTRKAVLIR